MDIDQKIRRLMDESFALLTTTPDGLLTTSCLAGLKLESAEYPRRMAVNAMKRTLYVNADWFEKLPVTQRAYVKAHETVHVLCGHCQWLSKVPESDKENGRIAVDLAVSSILEHTSLAKLRGDLDCWSPEAAGFPMDLTVDQYLTALKDKQESERKSQQDDKKDGDDEDENADGQQDTSPSAGSEDETEGEGDETSGDGDSEDDGDGSGDAGDSDDADSGDDTDSDSADGDASGEDDVPGGEVDDVPGDVAGDQGKGPASLKGMDDVEDDDGSVQGAGAANGSDDSARMIDALKNAGFSSGMFSAVMQARKADAIQWEVVLADFMEKSMGRTVCSYARPHRSYLWRGVAVPGKGKDDRMRSMALMLDTSGSIDDSAIEKALGTISDIVDKTAGADFELHLFQFSGGMEDYKLYQKRDFPLERCEVHGRGGTCLLPTFQYMLANSIAPAAIVIITDGYIADLSSIPIPPMPVLWLIDGCYQSFNAPFGIKVPLY
jgi:predicted metal-dependent peptidase